MTFPRKEHPDPSGRRRLPAAPRAPRSGQNAAAPPADGAAPFQGIFDLPVLYSFYRPAHPGRKETCIRGSAPHKPSGCFRQTAGPPPPRPTPTPTAFCCKARCSRLWTGKAPAGPCCWAARPATPARPASAWPAWPSWTGRSTSWLPPAPPATTRPRRFMCRMR